MVQKVRIEWLREARNPEIGRLVDATSGLRMTILHQNAVLYYYYFPVENIIELVLFWDTRQNPTSQNFRH